MQHLLDTCVPVHELHEAEAEVRALEARLRAVVEQWRTNADMLAEGNKSEGYSEAADMQRGLADQLDAILRPSATLTQPEKQT